MKYIGVSMIMLFLAGCASQTAADSSAAPDTEAVMLRPQFFVPSLIEVELDGQSYVGAWSRVPGQAPDRWLPFGSAVRHHVAHMQTSQATLESVDGARLDCRWVSHHEAVRGTCNGSAGRTYTLYK